MKKEQTKLFLNSLKWKERKKKEKKRKKKRGKKLLACVFWGQTWLNRKSNGGKWQKSHEQHETKRRKLTVALTEFIEACAICILSLFASELTALFYQIKRQVPLALEQREAKKERERKKPEVKKANRFVNALLANKLGALHLNPKSNFHRQKRKECAKCKKIVQKFKAQSQSSKLRAQSSTLKV